MIEYFFSLHQLITAWVQFEMAGNAIFIDEYLDMVTGISNEDNQ